MNDAETEYQSRMDALTPRERIDRSVAMFNWCREMAGRRILEEQGAMSIERLKLKVALRFYGSEPAMRQLIEGLLDRVSD